ncbi:MAG: type II toxin-antitoxin system HipA family toxin [Solirubrobacterales bacterium]
MAEITVEVLVQIAGEDVLAGRLWSHRRRAAESATFAYATNYLARHDAYELDPALPLVAGTQQTPAGRAIFGAFSDCAPDRWGRTLIHRAERERVRREGGAERSFGEIQYLLGVRDDLRQGALRFREPESETFLADERGGVPQLLDLPDLLGAAERLERDEASAAELRALLRGGSSLGGARPKAHVLDVDSRLAIAKFPSPAKDGWDVIRWEGVALRLAEEARITVPRRRLHTIAGRTVLIVDRFDRRGTERVGYVSAMTMLEAAAGEPGSYLDVADVIERHSPSAGEDLCQLWRRIAFSILISNTDDHLRNHGFVRASTASWSLSPAFDLNPNPEPGPKELSTAIDYASTAARIDMLVDVAEHFRLSGERARAVLHDVVQATSRWRTTAQEIGLDDAALEQMAPAFEHEQAERAGELTGSLAAQP